MKGGDSQEIGPALNELGDTILHLLSGLVRESHGQYPIGVHVETVHQIGDAVGQNARFS